MSVMTVRGRVINPLDALDGMLAGGNSNTNNIDVELTVVPTRLHVVVTKPWVSIFY